jgi:tetratricopeptide (TPR) repeat protein
MPSNEPRRAVPALAALLATLLAGCSLLPARAPAPVAAAASASVVSAGGPAPQPAGPEAAVAAAAPTVAPTVKATAVVVSADTQQTYQGALQALRAGRHAEAERTLRALAQALPALAGVQANLGLALRGTGRNADSLAALQQAAKLSPDSAPIHNELGIAYRLAGRFAPARQAYEKALSLQPAYAAAQLNLAILLDLYLGDSSAAMAHYERYQALVPGGDAAVGKWMVDLKNRKPTTASTVSSTQRVSAASPQEK